MSIFIQSIFAFFAIIAFSIVINAPKRCLVINGLLGMAGWAAYLFAARYIGSQLAATFISGLILAIASHILARALKSPLTTFLIPAILTIVPGAGMYQTVYYLFLSDVDNALYSLVYTIGAAGAIAIAIFFVDAFVIAIKRIVR
ncbi:MAG: threonine/serine exporter family protein [Lachnospira sp.]|nr:threonine/serine exporter family protein [Lachnospira sp.]